MNFRVHIAAITLVSAGICLLTLILSSVGGSASAADRSSQVAASRHAASSAWVASDKSDSDGLRRRWWKAGTVKDIESGKWKATVTDKRTGDSYCFGSYDTEEEAQSAADGQAKYNNSHGVVGAPECNVPPFWMEC